MEDGHGRGENPAQEHDDLAQPPLVKDEGAQRPHGEYDHGGEVVGTGWRDTAPNVVRDVHRHEQDREEGDGRKQESWHRFFRRRGLRIVGRPIRSGRAGVSKTACAKGGLLMIHIPVELRLSFQPSIGVLLMPRVSWPAIVVFTAACGGGAKDAPIQPPPSAVPVATTLAIQAGDNQTAPAGTSVAVNPSVIVRDQKGAAMSGVSVSFSVDSGGGRVASNTATTGADGIASSGRWTLGLGRNLLRATAGSLAPVIFTGTATGELTVADTAVGTGGGVVSVSRPGDALDGFSLTIPPGTLGEPLKVVARHGDTTGIVLRPGVRRLGSVITLATEGPGPVKGAPFELRLPGRAPVGTRGFVMLYDRATRAVEALPTVALASGGFAALTQHLDARLIASRPPTNVDILSRVSTAPFPALIQVIVGVVDEDSLKRPLDSGFRPAVDDWEFDHVLMGKHPSERHAPGLPLAAAWHFERRKQALGPLHRKYQKAAGVEWSNPMGYRMAFAASSLVDMNSIFAYNASIASLATISGVPPDSLVLLVAKTQLFLTGRPQLVLALDPADRRVAPLAMLAWRIQGSTMDIASGTSVSGANVPTSVSLVNGRFPPFQWKVRVPTGTDELYNPKTVWSTGQSAGIAAAAMAGLWQQFDAGTLASADFPAIRLASTDTRVVRDTVFVAGDTAFLWMECPTCTAGETPGPGVTPTGRVQPGILYERSGSAWRSLGTVRGNGVRLTAADSGKHAGFMLAESVAGGGAYNDWKEFDVALKRLTVTAAPKPAGGPQDYRLTATYQRPLPTGTAEWTWELGDGRTITSATNTVDVTYAFAGLFKPTIQVKARLRVGGVLEATGRTTITPPGAWTITSATVTHSKVRPIPSQGYRQDSLLKAMIGVGSIQGAIVLVEQPVSCQPLTCITGRVPDIVPEGLYFLIPPNGKPLTVANATSPVPRVYLDGYDSYPFLGAEARAVMLARTLPFVRFLPLCTDASEFFTRTGNAHSGRIRSRLYHSCASSVPTQAASAPVWVTEADVTFSGSTAQGTLISHYWARDAFTGVGDMATITMTFTATRMQ